ncbi:hypothetical protein J7K74_03760 [Candidatus Woesearchaeota archaeon]|nr:hypothetical protein [Candidatus Woesearchaeota archaeon]
MAIPGDLITRGSIGIDHLKPGTIELEIPIDFFQNRLTIAIDSTGVKFTSGKYLLSSTLLKYVKEAYLEAGMDSFTATDAAVAVELYNDTDGTVIASVTFSNDNRRNRSADIASSIIGLAGKEVSVRVNVTTASATAGATAIFKSARLILVLSIPKS